MKPISKFKEGEIIAKIPAKLLNDFKKKLKEFVGTNDFLMKSMLEATKNRAQAQRNLRMFFRDLKEIKPGRSIPLIFLKKFDLMFKFEKQKDYVQVNIYFTVPGADQKSKKEELTEKGLKPLHKKIKRYIEGVK